jgi:hypothetical protein
VTRSDLRDQVRIYLGETSSTDTYYTDAEINSQINRAMPLIAAEIEELITFKDYTTTSGTFRYSLEEDFLKIHKVFLRINDAVLSRVLAPLDIEEYERLSGGDETATGMPQWYKIELGSVLNTDDPQLPGDVWLYPTPDDNGGSNYKMRVYYYQKPDDLAADGEIPELPLQTHDTIALKAARALAIKGKDFGLAGSLQNLFLTEMASHREFFNRKSRDKNPEIKDLMGYGIDEDGFGPQGRWGRW